MKCNVGKSEQIVGIVIYVAIILLGLYYRSWWGIIGLAPIIIGSIHSRSTVIDCCQAGDFIFPSFILAIYFLD